MKALPASLAAVAVFVLPCVAADFWVERSPYFPVRTLSIPLITGEVVVSATQTLQSEIEVFDLKPGTPEYREISAKAPPESLVGAQSITYRINLITHRKPVAIWSQTIVSHHAPPALGPEFTLKDGWLDGKVCLLVIQHSAHAQLKSLVKEPNGHWKVTDEKEVIAPSYQPYSISLRKASPPAFVQNDWVNSVVTPVIRFYSLDQKLVAPPPVPPLHDPFDRGR